MTVRSNQLICRLKAALSVAPRRKEAGRNNRQCPHWPRRVIIGLAMISVMPLFTPHATAAEIGVQREKAAVLASFERWRKGIGHPSELLVPDAEWTLMGSSCLSRTYYGLKAVHDELADLLHARLSKPLVPQVYAAYQDGDTVIVRFSTSSTALDGKPFRNEYSWFLTFRDGRAIRLVAFLDTYAIDDLIHRITPPPGTPGEHLPKTCTQSANAAP